MGAHLAFTNHFDSRRGWTALTLMCLISTTVPLGDQKKMSSSKARKLDAEAASACVFILALV